MIKSSKIPTKRTLNWDHFVTLWILRTKRNFNTHCTLVWSITEFCMTNILGYCLGTLLSVTRPDVLMSWCTRCLDFLGRISGFTHNSFIVFVSSSIYIYVFCNILCLKKNLCSTWSFFHTITAAFLTKYTRWRWQHRKIVSNPTALLGALMKSPKEEVFRTSDSL